jgi:hypothetical protein
MTRFLRLWLACLAMIVAAPSAAAVPSREPPAIVHVLREARAHREAPAPGALPASPVAARGVTAPLARAVGHPWPCALYLVNRALLR